MYFACRSETKIPPSGPCGMRSLFLWGGCIEIKFNQNRFTKKLFFRFFTSIYPKVFQKTKNLKARIAYADRFQNMKKSKFAFHIMSWYIGYSWAIWPGLTWRYQRIFYLLTSRLYKARSWILNRVLWIGNNYQHLTRDAGFWILDGIRNVFSLSSIEHPATSIYLYALSSIFDKCTQTRRFEAKLR